MRIREEVISARANPLVKWAASLQDKKGRQKEGAFLAEGEKLTLEAVDRGLPIKYIFVNEAKAKELLPVLAAHVGHEGGADGEIVLLKKEAFEKISTEKAPQGIITVIKALDFFFNMDIIYKEEFFLEPDERAIALDSVRDPSNLGSVIRSAVAFGIDHIVLSSDCADIYNPKTVRSSMGSMFGIKATYVKDFASFIRAAGANGRRVLSAELNPEALSLRDANLQPSDIVVIGNEGHGVSADVSAACDSAVYIPISEGAESLNAAVAAAVFMWEISK